MKLKNLTMLTLGVSALMGSVSANADDTTQTSSLAEWRATATVETSAKLSISHKRTSLAFVYVPATDSFNIENDTLYATLLADANETTKGIVLTATLESNTLTNKGKYLNVLASIGETSITSAPVTIFDGSIKNGNVAFDSLKGAKDGSGNSSNDGLSQKAESTASISFYIDYDKGSTVDGKKTVSLEEGQYEGQVIIRFTTNWTHEASA